MSPILTYPIVWRTYPFVSETYPLVSVAYPYAPLTILLGRSATDSGRPAAIPSRSGQNRIDPLQWKCGPPYSGNAEGAPWEFGDS